MNDVQEEEECVSNEHMDYAMVSQDAEDDEGEKVHIQSNTVTTGTTRSGNKLYHNRCNSTKFKHQERKRHEAHWSLCRLKNMSQQLMP